MTGDKGGRGGSGRAMVTVRRYESGDFCHTAVQVGVMIEKEQDEAL